MGCSVFSMLMASSFLYISMSYDPEGGDAYLVSNGDWDMEES